MDQQRPTRRMTDMGPGPRRMDGFGRSGAPAGPAQQRPMARPGVGQPPQTMPQRPAQPVSAQPMQQPMRRPMQPMPQRPMAAGGQPPMQQRMAQQRPQRRVEQYKQDPMEGVQQQVEQDLQPELPRKTSAWKVVLQFVLGLAVIIGVAAAIVALYIRYYQP